MKTGNRSTEGRGVAAATIAFVAMLMIGQTAPMEYVRDASLSADTVVYDTLEFTIEENSAAPVLDLFSTVSNADDCKMFVQGNDYLDNQHFTTPSNGMVSPDATMADVGLDYENPQDADADNSYEFRVRTHCPGNDITARNYFLNVTNVVFDIAGSGTGTISEDAAAGTAVWAPTGMNDTTANCAISEGDSGSLFAINTTTCAITTAGAFDYDTTPSHTLNVTASTAGDLESDYHIVTVTVTDVNEAPTGHLEITGTLTEGETISADATGVSDEDGMNMTDAEYQWYRGGAAIAGETSSTYTLTNDDSLQSMQVSMTYNDTAGRSTMVMSNASAAVSDVDNHDPASTAIPNLPACASSSPSPSHRGAPLNGTFEPAAVDASFASGPLMFHARHHRGESLLGGDFNAETITVTFVDKDGEEEVVEAQVGKNLLEIAHMNDIELEGACEGEFCSPQVSLSLSLSLPPSLCRDETTTRALQRHRHRGLTHPPPLSPSARARVCVCVCVCASRLACVLHVPRDRRGGGPVRPPGGADGANGRRERHAGLGFWTHGDQQAWMPGGLLPRDRWAKGQDTERDEEHGGGRVRAKAALISALNIR